MKKIYGLLFILSSFLFIHASQISQIEDEFGKRAAKRYDSWQHLIQRLDSETEYNKVRQVNAFFNRYRYKSDAYNWKTVEYWATFKEFVGKGGGDCEDFALAKYYTLRQLNVPSHKLKLMTGLYANQGHMILVYYKDGSDPYILDKNNRYLIRLSESKRFKAETYFNENSYGLIKKSIDNRRVLKEYELFLSWWSKNQ